MFNTYISALDEAAKIYCKENHITHFEFLDEYRFTNLCHLMWNMGLSFHKAAGCTKGCIIPYDSDMVIKIPFFANQNTLYPSGGSNSGSGGYSFTSSKLHKSGMDYCDREAEIYLDAKNTSFVSLFAATKKITEICNIPIYYQPRCDSYEYTCDYSWYDDDSYTDEDTEQAEDIWDCFNHPTEVSWLRYAIKLYGPNVLYDFADFCNYENINDMHNGNYGTTVTDQPVLFDYSGYFN